MFGSYSFSLGCQLLLIAMVSIRHPLSENSILPNNWFNVWNLQKYLTWGYVSLNARLLFFFFNHCFSFLLPLTKHMCTLNNYFAPLFLICHGWIILELGTLHIVYASAHLSSIFCYIYNKCFHASLWLLITNKAWDERGMQWASSGHHKIR